MNQVSRYHGWPVGGWPANARMVSPIRWTRSGSSATMLATSAGTSIGFRDAPVEVCCGAAAGELLAGWFGTQRAPSQRQAPSGLSTLSLMRRA